ncbi:MAG: hypothetical protein KF809_15310 [Chloroflexi bacterium]|nr:hypothetical protein [Chloroflexota bacterium]
MTATSVRYLARPRFLGALGRPDPTLVARVRANASDLTVVIEEPDVLLLASWDIEPYRSDATGRAWVLGDRQPSAGSRWRDAALALDAPGIAVEPERVTLHAGAVGFMDVFTRRLGGATWFASRMEELLALDDAPVEVDWDAWASILVFQYPVGEATPFLAIRRLQGARTVVLDRVDGQVRDERWDPPWIGLDAVDPDAGDPGLVWETARAAVARLPSGPVALGLSGGHDSRLLAIALRSAGRDMTLWSTQKDDGLDDIGVTAELAEVMGLPVRLVDRDAAGVGPSVASALERVEHMTPLPYWLEPLTREVRREGQPIAEALMAAKVLKSVRADTDSADPREAHMRAKERQDPDGGILAGPAVAWAFPAAHRAWRAATADLADDTNVLMLSEVRTRAVRGIANMSVWLYGPEIRVDIPFTDPDFIVAGLSVGQRRKLDDGFYRELLAVADPVLGTMRMAVKGQSKVRGYTYLMASEDSRRWLAERLTVASAVPGLVAPGLVDYVRPGTRSPTPSRLGRLLRRDDRAQGGRAPGGGTGKREAREAQQRMRLTFGRSLPLVTLGDWVERHRQRLASIDPPWEESPQRQR